MFKKRRKVAIVMAIMLMTTMSFESINLRFINEVKAGIVWFADESGDTETCWKQIRVENASTLSTVPLSLSITEKYALVKGSQDSCEDASILYACRRSCVSNANSQAIMPAG